MRYAKLINNQLSYAPNPILHNDNYTGNAPPEVYWAEGYKQVQYTGQPEPQGAGWWNEVWEETGEAIVQGWQWHEATDGDELTDIEALNLLLGGVDL